MRAIDPAVYALLPEFEERIRALGPAGLVGIGTEASLFSLDSLRTTMEEADVERVGLVAFWSSMPGCFVTADELAPLIARRGGSLFGIVGLNPLLPFEDEHYAPRYLDRAVKELGFKGAHVALHWWGLPPNDKRLYPIYDACLELDVPVVLPLGMAPPRSGARSVAEPHLLDPVIGDFPQLRIVGQRAGYPWEREAVYLARNNEHFAVLADWPAPQHWPPDLVAFIKQGRFPKHDAGSDQAMWGSNFPFTTPADSRRALEALGFGDEMLAQLLRDNAIRIFKLDGE